MHLGQLYNHCLPVRRGHRVGEWGGGGGMCGGG